MNPALVERELEKVDDHMSRTTEQLRAKEPETVAEWEKLKERFNRRAEELQVTGKIDEDEEREDGLDPEILQFIADEPLVSLTRRNYTEDDPWVNPDTEAHEYVQSLLKRTKEDLKMEFKGDEEEADGLAFVTVAALRPFGASTFPRICPRQPAMAFAPRPHHRRARLNPMFCPAAVRTHRRVGQLRARQGPEEHERADPVSRLVDLVRNRTTVGDIDSGLLACDAAVPSLPSPAPSFLAFASRPSLLSQLSASLFRATRDIVPGALRQVIFSGIFACGAVRAGALEGVRNAFGILKPLSVADGHLWESLNLGGSISGTLTPGRTARTRVSW